MMKLNKWISIGGLFVTMIGAGAAMAAEKTYSITGEVTNISGDTLTVRQGVEEFNLSKKDLDASAAKNLHKGDRVTVFYTMNAKRIGNVQEAGQARPGEVPPNKQHIIQDDRIFQTAGLNDGKNASPESQQPGTSSDAR